ncbi:type II secretion system protein E, partial [mine drainage metagenome]
GKLQEWDLSPGPTTKGRMLYYLERDFIGYGLVDVPMTDSEVEDISCDGVGIPLYIYHRKHGSIRSNLRFESEKLVDDFVIWLAQRSGKHISVASPILDATVPDGSRLQATLGKHVTKRGSSFTIRRFRDNPFTPVDLLKFRTMSPEMMAYLWIAIEHGQSMMVCGGTGEREDDDPERDPPVHPAPDEDRLDRGYAGAQPPARQLGPVAHPRRLRREERHEREGARGDRHVRPPRGRAPPRRPQYLM